LSGAFIVHAATAASHRRKGEPKRSIRDCRSEKAAILVLMKPNGQMALLFHTLIPQASHESWMSQRCCWCATRSKSLCCASF